MMNKQYVVATPFTFFTKLYKFYLPSKKKAELKLLTVNGSLPQEIKFTISFCKLK